MGDRIGWTLRGEAEEEGGRRTQAESSAEAILSLSGTARHFCRPYSHAERPPLLLRTAARRGWPRDATWRALCGKY